MTQNLSSAVRAQRREPPDSLDFFPTRGWATRALCEWLFAQGDVGGDSVWEPACGQGHMSRVLGEYFRAVCSSDVHDYGFGETLDFLLPWPALERPDWIVTNPPFRLASEFVSTALARARRGVAVIVRTAFLEGAERYHTLFRDWPPSEVLQFCERVPMHRGRVEAKGSTATAYCWLVCRTNIHGAPFSRSTTLHWLAPCRARLERAGDYAAAEAGA